MKQVMPGNQLTRGLLITSTALACIVAIEWYLLQHMSSDDRSELQLEVTDDSPLSIEVYSAPSIELFDEILARPLFIEGREPPEEPENEQPTPVTPDPVHFNLLLEGIAITPATRIAVVREINSRKLLRLEEGTEHQGWKLEHVSTTGATFTQNTQTRELTLEIDTKTGITRKPGITPGRRPNYAGDPVTLDQIRIKKPTPPPSTPRQIPSP